MGKAFRFRTLALASALFTAAVATAAAEKQSSDAQASPPEAEKPASLTIASWGGAYAKSQELAFVKPFESKTGIKVTLVSHRGALDKLKRADEDSPPVWDVVDLGAGALDAACKEGLLEKIGGGDLVGDDGGELERDDFLPGALHECGVASVAWSSTIVYDRNAFKKGAPTSASDFFNTERFPGKRALPRDPKYILPLALMADGLEADVVYRELETRGGVNRALAMLEKIKGQTLWWRKSHEPLKMLADDTVTMAVAFNGRAFYAIARDNRKFGLVWDGQIYDLDMWAVPKGTPNRDAAIAFIAFSIKPDRLAEQTRWFPYGPMRRSAIAKIGRHAEAGIEMRRYVPTAEENFRRALRIDDAWWEEHSERVTEQFETWLTKADEKQPQDSDAVSESRG